MTDPGDEESLVTGFRATRGGGVTARFAAGEALLLRSLVSQVAELVGEGLPVTGAAPQPGLEELVGLSENSRPPEDPILARLLPDAYSDDEASAGEFRRYTEHGLRSGKVAAAQTVLETLPDDGGRVRLTEDQGQAWLRSINDVRLALGVQLDVTEDTESMADRAGQGGPQAVGLAIYDWLTFLQQTLVHALW